MTTWWLDGLVAGAVGGMAMTATEKLEQRFGGRPNSYVPAVTLGRLVGVADETAERSRWLNWGMHYGQAALLGVLRGAMAEGGLRGLRASLMFTSVRLTNDQTLENYTGSGAPPWTWPRSELLTDVAHKLVYGIATGLVADRLASRRGPGAGNRHASLRPGRRPDVGPPPERS